MWLRLALCLVYLVVHGMVAVDSDQEEIGDSEEVEYEDYDETEEDYDDDYEDDDDEIEDLDYDALKEIEKSLNSMNIDPVPKDDPEDVEEYKRMKRMRASLDGLVDEDMIGNKQDDHEEVMKMMNSKIEL